MLRKNRSKNNLKKAIISGFLMLFGLFGGMLLSTTSEPAFAVRANTTDATTIEAGAEENEETIDTGSRIAENNCKKVLGSAGWFICPITEGISKMVDTLYGLLERILVINPIPSEEGTPIYEIWRYCRGMTNVVFIIFLLIVIYSQLTGIGITNYGIKRTLPKLIIAAMLVNLSFLICSLAVDVSNILGNSLTGLFNSVAESAVAGNPESGGYGVSALEMFAAIGSGAVLTIGGAAVAFNYGLLFMLIPTALAGLFALLAGLFTLMLRQAVVPLLIMISPLAMVAYMLPNTEDWFKKWKKLLTQMLVFYPMFSILVGASHLAGFAIIASAKDGFAVLLGWAVQILPLFLSVSLMKMSGTFLSSVNAKLNSLAAKPVAANRAWADSHRQLKMEKHLERNRMPSAKLMNALDYRRNKRESEIDKLRKQRQLKYTAARSLAGYNKDGTLNKAGQKEYDRQALAMRYTQAIKMHEHSMNEGFGEHREGYRKTISNMKKDLRPALKSNGVYASAIEKGSYEDRIEALDNANMNASDALKTEMERGAEIEYKNARGFYERTINAQYAYDDDKARGRADHQKHTGVFDDKYVADDPANLERYHRMRQIMGGDPNSVQTVLSGAASSFSAQAKIRNSKFQVGAALTPATQTVVDHLEDLIGNEDKMKNIDAILGGLSVLNTRGDTDLLARRMTRELTMKLGDGIVLNADGTPKFCDESSLILGTYASQAVANFAMFEVGDNDPLVRRFGKYINLQTAKLYNDKDPDERRVRKDVSWYEYINGEYIEHNEDGTVAIDENGDVKTVKTKSMRELMKGTSYSGIERTAFQEQLEGVRAASYDIKDGKPDKFSVERFLKNKTDLDMAIMANIIGDHLSYRSQSEQIVAFAKYMTGIGDDGYWDWKYIFGEENMGKDNEGKDKISIEDKEEYIKHSKEMIKTFLGGQTPSHLQRTKSDLFESIKSQFALFDEVMYLDENDLDENGKPKEKLDINKLKSLESEGVGDRKDFAEKHKKAIIKRLLHTYSKKTLAGFAKALEKGFMPEAKASYLDYMPTAQDIRKEFKEEFERGGRGNKKDNQEQNNEDDDGGGILTTSGNEADLRPGNEVDSEIARKDVKDICDEYLRNGNDDVQGCWSRVKNIIDNPAIVGGNSAEIKQIIDDIERTVGSLSVDGLRTMVCSKFGWPLT